MCADRLETLENEHPLRDYKITIDCPEFTCLCPEKRDQPDFAVITLTYVPDKRLIELKSLKYYLTSYRNKEIYHEAATNQIFQDLVEALEPRYLKVKGDWNVRGGITTKVEVEHFGEDWKNSQKVISHYHEL